MKIPPASPDSSLIELVDGIKFYLKQIGQNIIEIGLRLNLAREKVPHGDWQNWLDTNFNLKRQSAQNFMNIAKRFGSNYRTSGNLNQSQLIEMLALPVGAEEKFIADKEKEGTPVADMSVRSLRGAIKKYNNKYYSALKSMPAFTDSSKVSPEIQADNPGIDPIEQKDFLTQKIKTPVVNTDSLPNDSLTQFFNLMSDLRSQDNLKDLVANHAELNMKLLEKQIKQISAFHENLSKLLDDWKFKKAAQDLSEIQDMQAEAQTAGSAQRTLSIDVETFCDLDIKTVGSYRYTENCMLLLCAFAFDDEPVQIVDIAMGEKLPQNFVDALFDPNVLKTAYNASFEIRVLNKYLKKNLDPAQWLCTMVHGLSLGLPSGLAKIGEALQLPSNKKKLAEGKKLIQYFCLPRMFKNACSSHNLNLFDSNDTNRNLPQQNLAKWNEFKAYCKQDVEAERAVRKKLEKFPLPDAERKLWCLDQKINSNGILIDMNLVEGAIAIYSEIEKNALQQAKILTGGLNLQSNVQIMDWIETQEGIKLDTFDKTVREKLLSANIKPNVRQVIELRNFISKTSVKKFSVMQAAACADNRARGMFQFYGANRTGRWSGCLIQPQNLPQNHFNYDELLSMRESVRTGNLQEVQANFDISPSEILSQITRTALVAEENHRLLIADFSAIEARVIAWLANEKWRMDVFANGGDIYCASASTMFKVPVEKNGANKELRAKGKIAELACGFGGGVNALKAFGADKLGLSDSDMHALIKNWRASNQNICKLWRHVENCVADAVKTGTQQIGFKGLVFEVVDDFLFITLPGGRKISYFKPILQTTQKGGINKKFDSHCITYNGSSNVQTTWGGKLVENIVQAIARDCLSAAMLKLDALGYKIVMHVHDEIICEMPLDKGNLDEIIGVMCEPINWAPGLILSAEGYTSNYYLKN